MNDIWKNDKDFKQAIGGFIIAFSELEFGLVFLCTMTEFDLRKSNSYTSKYLGFTFEKKSERISEFINDNLLELKPIWDKLKVEIKQLNRERRFLAHGFLNYFLPNETITTHIKEKGEIVTKQHTVEEIIILTNRLHQLNTGENGINGEFHTLFTKTRIDRWNELVNDDAKIIYKLNDRIISNWKGKDDD
jgi:hypothetical protein